MCSLGILIELELTGSTTLMFSNIVPVDCLFFLLVHYFSSTKLEDEEVRLIVGFVSVCLLETQGMFAWNKGGLNRGKT